MPMVNVVFDLLLLDIFFKCSLDFWCCYNVRNGFVVVVVVVKTGSVTRLGN